MSGIFWLAVGLACTPVWLGPVLLAAGVASTVAVWRLT